MIEPSRHDLIWLKPSQLGHVKLVGGSPVEVERGMQCLHDWVEAGHPLIVARQPDEFQSVEKSGLQVGLALPPSMGKLRLAFAVPASAIASHRAPWLLSGSIAQLPQPWVKPLSELAALPAVSACRPAVYGSGLMQMVTGIHCITEYSDVDLLFYPNNQRAYTDLLQALATWSLNHPDLRVDGEVVNANAWASAWRDCAGTHPSVLAKAICSVQLMSKKEFECWTTSDAGCASDQASPLTECVR